ncbi:arylamine N-acetyltransferase, pineal gland isozyme NAT-10 [Diplogelasinospora grovesii]|uniref:Arylamine N-acetyltransferase, pineal gland isozyme NAT-10 n=1 Tax=Diplogelasinospora grovesii TaxID=303347 RepID=A0AAN6NB80_9PEZI|nr:arylamine N-acetyltransferase, pineal gland isozyme NAT-10 [Diplogelasinospora grovesii]
MSLHDSAYSPAQLAEYLNHVGLPQSFHPSSNPVLDATYLNTLFAHQITTIPYDNLSIHYSPSHSISLDPQVLFHKLISSKRGRGGYCMENSILFHHILRCIGFDIYMSGVRVRPRTNGIPGGDYGGWVHLVNIVTLPDGSRYALDAGFGGDGPTIPMPLVENLSHHNSIGTQEIRLIRDYIPNQRYRQRDEDKLWIYQYRNGSDREWLSFYAFPEWEFTEADFGVVNHFTHTSPDSFQTFTTLVIKFLPTQEPVEGEGVYGGKRKVGGKIMLVQGEVKQNVTGRTELVKTCKTEQERLEALKEYFGIVLTQEEAEAIKGRSVELGATVAMTG